MPFLSFPRCGAMNKSAMVDCFKTTTKLGLAWNGAPSRETGLGDGISQKEKDHAASDARHPGQVCGGCYKLVNRESRGSSWHDSAWIGRAHSVGVTWSCLSQLRRLHSDASVAEVGALASSNTGAPQVFAPSSLQKTWSMVQ